MRMLRKTCQEDGILGTGLLITKRGKSFLPRFVFVKLVQRILSNRHIDLSDFSYAALSSIAVATATPHSSALHMRKSSCVNIADT